MATGRRAKQDKTAPPAGPARWGVLLLILVAMQAPWRQPIWAQDSAPPDAVPSVESAELSDPDAAQNPFEGDLLLQARALRGLKAEVAGLALAGKEGGDLSVAVLAVPIPSSVDGTASVPVFVEIDGASFLQHHKGDLARLEVYLYAVDGENRIHDYVAEAIPVDVSELGERIWQSGLEFFARLELAPGDYSLRALVRDFRSRVHGLRSFALHVPSFDDAAARALTPLIAEPIERDVWLPVRSWRGLTGSGGKGTPVEQYPLAELGLAMNPAVQPVLPVGRASELTLPVMSTGETMPEARLELIAVAPDGSPGGATIVPVEVLGRAESPLPGIELLTLRFVVPGLQQGVYRAHVRLGSQGKALSAGLETIVVDAETRDRGLLWSDMRWLLTSGSGSRTTSFEPAPVPETKRAQRLAGKRAVQELEDHYRVVLRKLSEGTAEAARGELFELESNAVAGADGGRRETLLTAEVSVANELAARDSSLVLPLVLLHREMYGRYRGRKNFTLLVHTRGLLEQLVDLYVAKGGDPEIGADMLSSLAGDLQRANLLSGCRRLFARALEVQSDNAAALLGLAATFEKHGDYQPALDLLEHLVAAAPGLSEPKLRLALTLNRVGLRRRARELLEELMTSGSSEWVRAVAYEETARILLQTGDVGAATTVLDAGVEAMPNRQGLRLLAAHAYDRQGLVGEALDHLDAVSPDSRKGHSERLEYDRWPHRELDRIDQLLRRLATESGPALGQALGRVAQSGQEAK